MHDDWQDLVAAVASSEPTKAAFDVCFAIARREVDCRVLTVTLNDAAQLNVERAYSSLPEEWPVGGRKPLSLGKWSETVVVNRQPFVANSHAELAEVFTDHAINERLGLGSIVNVPVVVGGVVRGTANLLNVSDAYDAPRVAKALALTPYFTMALLTAL